MTQHQYPFVPPGAPPAQPQTYPHQSDPRQAYPIAPHQRQSSADFTNTYLELGKFGAVVGLCGAGAANLRRLQAEQVTGGVALFDTLRTGVAAGLATAMAGIVANQFRSPVTSLVATLGAGTTMMYILNTETTKEPTTEAPAGDEA